MKFKRIFLIVLDSLGIGEATDAIDYGDEGANTLLHILEKTNIILPNLKELGLLNLVSKNNTLTNAYYARCNEKSMGKDTLTGHLEMMGIRIVNPFKTYTDTGFPVELIRTIESKIGRKVIGNYSAGGTDIINRLGEEHIKTGSIIIYTSVDSVLQIAAHESVIPIKELYRICHMVRDITSKGEWQVGRVIARPFNGKPGNFIRTTNRRDYALNPPSKTTLDHLKDGGFSVISIGKIANIFNNQGITKSIDISDNLDGINKVIDTINTRFKGLCYVNLNDFDSKYGHRRNVDGYANALLEFDNYLYEIISSLKDDDLLMITSDHGNDPTYKGGSHTRENLPLLVYANKFKKPKRLPELSTLGDIGATISDNFGVKQTELGTSFLEKLI